MKNKSICINLLLWVILLWAPNVTGGDSGPSVVVRFDSGKAFLDDAEKVKLRQLFQTYDVTGAGRVFVLGYTDSRGGSNSNYGLSRKRAQAVQREIVSAFGIDATVVMALGKGPESPVADNGQADGRAQNRRAEVYLANAVARRPQRTYGPDDPHLPAITDLVQEADTLVRERRIDEALKKLGQAHAIGGDHYSDWHTVMGIAGFYAGAPQSKSHLATAVQLDPYNYKAREFLSRLQARRKVTDGKVTAAMGQRPETAIPITAVVQAHEYLRLFGVQPVSHRELANQPIQVWACVDEKGRPVIYHFNHAPVFRWAFAKDTAMQAPQANMTAEPLDGAALNTQPLPSAGSQKVWESKIFK